ncbi:MAG: DUF3631 domain-containing protein [Acidimicrobiia bacterium]|nr:DUF3631 domain-containing protein [Acidimicrobiia bacterium]
MSPLSLVPEHGPEETDGAGLLDDVAAFLARFVAFDGDAQRDATALWTVHAHAVDAAETTPRLAIQSAEKQSGKTRLLEVLDLVVPAALPVANISPAAMFRVVADGPVTLLVDEVDAIFGPKANGNYEDLRALLNAGYRRGATVARVVGEGKKMEVRRFPVYAPVALAGIGTLPDTIQDRSIVITLRRRAPGEPIAKLRRRLVLGEATDLRDRIAGWVADRLDILADAYPSTPDELSDRAADCWEPLVAIADEAGGDWPERARHAARALSTGGDDELSLGVRLLGDIRAIYADAGTDRLSSADLVERLHAIEESPWGDWFDARRLAAKLRPFGARPRQHRFGEKTLKGYLVDDFVDAWARYLPTPEKTETCVASETPQATPTSTVSAVDDVSLSQGGEGEDDAYDPEAWARTVAHAEARAAEARRRKEGHR